MEKATNNYMQVGDTIACGACDDRFEHCKNLPIECDCVCHNKEKKEKRKIPFVSVEIPEDKLDLVMEDSNKGNFPAKLNIIMHNQNIMFKVLREINENNPKS